MITMRFPQEPQTSSPSALLHGSVLSNGQAISGPWAVATAEFRDGSGSPVLPVDSWKFTSSQDSILFDAVPVDDYGNKECLHQKVDAIISMKRDLISSPKIKLSSLPTDFYPFGSFHPGASGWSSSTPYTRSVRRAYDGSLGSATRCSMPSVSYPISQPLAALVPLDTCAYTMEYDIVNSNHKSRVLRLWGVYSSRVLPRLNGPVFTFTFAIVYTGDSGGTWVDGKSNSWSIWVSKPASSGSVGECYLASSSLASWSDRATRGSSFSQQGKLAFSGFPGFKTKFSSMDEMVSWIETSVFSRGKLMVAQSMLTFPATFTSYGPYWTEGYMSSSPSYDEKVAAKSEASDVLGALVAASQAFVGSGISSLSDKQSLGNQCIEGCYQFSSNLLAYAADLKKVGDSIKAILALVQSPANPRAWANAWLSSRFGDTLTWHDTKQLMLAVRSEISHVDGILMDAFVTRARRSDVVQGIPASLFSAAVKLNYQKAYFMPRDWNILMKAVRKTQEWDLWPTLENVWDLIPLSFVVDWFVNVGGLLKGIDNAVYMQYVDVKSICTSEKVVFDCNPSWLSSHLSLSQCLQAQCVVYKRRHTSYLTWEPFGEVFSHPSAVNVVDGMSLLIQRG